MRLESCNRRMAVTGFATALAAGSLGLAASPAAAVLPAGAPVCTDAVSTSGPTLNGDGTTSQIVVNGETPFTVPANVTSLSLDICGAQGVATAGSSGGFGGRSVGTLSVTPGDVLYLRAGGSDGSPGGGGAAGAVGAGAGGGYSAVYTGGAGVRANTLLLAGGGGGAGAGGGMGLAGGAGGAGGDEVASPGAFGSGAKTGGGGQPGNTSTNSGGAGGSGGLGNPASAGTSGAQDQGGAGGNGTGAGGGGGGGWYGGGGGGGTNFSTSGAGGGGGSGYVSGSVVGSTDASTRAGDGVVIVTYQAGPAITTQASAPITLGAGSISDSATVSTTGRAPTGTVTFDVFGPNDATCSGGPVSSSTNAVTAGDSASTPYPPTAGGVYRFIASYSGDGYYSPSSGACNDPNESTTVNPAASGISTQASGPITLGAGSISDSATVTTTGPPPTGTVTFDVFGPDNTTCSGPPVSSSTNAVTAGDSSSTPYTPTAGGGYRFIATYNGDGNNAAVSGACNDANESTTVNPAASGISTRASAPVTIGAGSISDSATVTTSSGVTPTGTVTFVIFGPNDVDCTGTPAASSTNAVTAGDAASTPFTPGDTGIYRFIATYNGDGNNLPVSGACNDANESTIVNAPLGGGSPGPSPSASPTASPTASPSASTTASPSASSSPPGRQSLTLSVLTPSVPAGSTGQLRATGAANEDYSLQCYTRPSTAYVDARSGTFNATGDPVTFTLSLGRNTRCFIQYATNPSQGASPSVVINVRTVLSLSTVRTALRTYVFQGRNLPRVAGQLITLYRVDGAGNEIRTANLRTDDSGIYRLTRTFTGTGAFRFRVRTPQTLNNAAGVSNTIRVTIH